MTDKSLARPTLSSSSTTPMSPSNRSSVQQWPSAQKPVAMKFFGAWEVDKTPANCIPRLCTLTITRLILSKPLGPDITSSMIAVKMQSSKRTLRSNEITIPNLTESPDEKLEIELDLTFSLQYPHFIKKGGNFLQILLQRRKKYKNHAILGYKTLAIGFINMAEVLQRSNCMDKELELRSNIKDLGKNEVVARVVMSTLKSQPIDQDGTNVSRSRMKQYTLDRSAEGDSDEDAYDFTSNEEGSDSEAVEENPVASNAPVASSTRERINQWRRQVNSGRKYGIVRSIGSEIIENGNVGQRNFKQKIIALLKRLRIPNEAFESDEQYQEALEQGLMVASAQNDNDIADLLEEDDIGDWSDSGQEFDEISISSTPKPSLRPYFSTWTLEGNAVESEANGVERIETGDQNIIGAEQTPDTSDTSLKQQGLEEMQEKQANDKKSSKLRRILGYKDSTTKNTQVKSKKSSKD